jgi:hypothetical protein
MASASHRPRIVQALLLVLGLTVAFAILVGTGIGGSTVVRTADDGATAAAALAAAALCARAARAHADRLRAFWSLLAAACGAWTIGEGLWGVYDLTRDSVPESSWADVGYLAALPLAGAALLTHPALQGRVVGKTRSVVDGLVLATSLFLIGWLLVLEPLQRTVDLGSRDGIVTMSYPLGDVVILLLIVLVIRGTTDHDRLDLWLLLAGLLLIAGSDAVYTYLSSTRDYGSGGLVDTGWFAGYLAIALAALGRSRVALVTPRRSSGLTRAALVTPFVPMLAALALVAVEVEVGHPLDHVGLLVSFALVGLVLLRQALLLTDVLTAPRGHAGDNAEHRLVAALGRTAGRRPPLPGGVE